MFSTIVRFLSSVLDTAVPAQPAGMVNRLMESAEACAGQDPHYAHELRQAAQAYLRVIR